MAEIYARINGVNLYRYSLASADYSALLESDGDFLPIGVTDDDNVMKRRHIVAISWATAKALHLD